MVFSEYGLCGGRFTVQFVGLIRQHYPMNIVNPFEDWSTCEVIFIVFVIKIQRFKRDSMILQFLNKMYLYNYDCLRNTYIE